MSFPRFHSLKDRGRNHIQICLTRNKHIIRVTDDFYYIDFSKMSLLALTANLEGGKEFILSSLQSHFYKATFLHLLNNDIKILNRSIY